MKAKEGVPTPGGGEGGNFESWITGVRPLYPKLTESPALMWAFILKVLAVQLLPMFAVFSVFFLFVGPISKFFLSRTASSSAVYLTVAFSPHFVSGPLLCYPHRHPVNMILLGLHAVFTSASAGMVCSVFEGCVATESKILTATVVLNTFWAFSVAMARSSSLSYSRPSGYLWSTTSPSSQSARLGSCLY